MSTPTIRSSITQSETLQKVRRLENKLASTRDLLFTYRSENTEMREKWNMVLEACCNAEAESEKLQNDVETLQLKLVDSEEALRRQVEECFRLSAELNGIKLVNTKSQGEIESKMAKLVREYDTLQKNYSFVMQHKAELERLINDAKPIMEKLREENRDLKAKQVNSEHLAKQVVKLQAEVVKNDSTSCSYQRGDQNYIRCGNCVRCKLEAAEGIIKRTTDNVAAVEAQREEASRALKFTKNILEETIKNLETANQEKETLASHVKRSVDEIGKLRQMAIRDQEIISTYRAALEKIEQGAFFSHKGIAARALERMKEIAKIYL